MHFEVLNLIFVANSFFFPSLMSFKKTQVLMSGYGMVDASSPKGQKPTPSGI